MSASVNRKLELMLHNDFIPKPRTSIILCRFSKGNVMAVMTARADINTDSINGWTPN